jgi:hypothetical protein
MKDPLKMGDECEEAECSSFTKSGDESPASLEVVGERIRSLRLSSEGPQKEVEELELEDSGRVGEEKKAPETVHRWLDQVLQFF